MKLRKNREFSIARRNPIRDKITVRDGDDTLELTVYEEHPERMVAALLLAQKNLQALTEGEPTREETCAAALELAGAMFYEGQAQKLLDFYHGDPACVIDICGQYFRDVLTDKITRAQVKTKK